MPQKYDQQIQNLVNLASNVTDAFTSALFLVDEVKRNRLTLASYQSLSNNIIPNATIRLGHGLIGWVAKNERATVATNFRHDTKTLQFYSTDEDIKSFAAAPIFADGTLIGVLSVDSKREYVFTEKKLKILTEFADTFAGVISMGKKRIRLHSEAADINALSELAETIACCSNLSELDRAVRMRTQSLIRHDFLVLAVRSGDDDEFRIIDTRDAGKVKTASKPFPLSHYRLGWVIRQARAIYIPDLDAPVFPGDTKKWRSFIGSPMISNGHVTGAIGLLSRKPGAFKPVNLKSLAILASTISSSITSLYLQNRNHHSEQVDPLTKTINYKYALEKFTRSGKAGCIAIVDLKRFTDVNHELGMGGGDSVLVGMSQRLGRIVKGVGLVSRFCGDKFIISLPGLSRPESSELLAGIVSSIESAPFHYEGTDIHITPVIGAAVNPGDGVDAERLLVNAQIAVDRAKRNPGACVFFHGDSDLRPEARLRSARAMEPGN